MKCPTCQGAGEVPDPPPREPRDVAPCQRCGEMLTTHSAGNFAFGRDGKVTEAVCYACLRPEED